MSFADRVARRVHSLPLRVATKFALAFFFSATLVMTAYTFVVCAAEERRALRTASEDLSSDARVLAIVASGVWRHDGEERAHQVVRAAADDVLEVFVVDPASEPRLHAGRGAVVARSAFGTPAGAREIVLRRRVPALAAILSEDALPSLIAAVVFALVSIGASYWLGRFLVVAPIERVVAQAKRIGAGDLTQRLSEDGSLEIVRLKHALNAMCDQMEAARERADRETEARLEALDRLRHADRLRTVGTLAAGIAHELGTPLNVVLLRAKQLERSGDERIAEHGRIVRECTLRMTRIVRQLLDFARRNGERREGDVRPCGEVAIETVVARVREMLEPLCRSREVALDVEVDAKGADSRVRIEERGLEQVLTNVIVNAIDASPAGGHVRVRVFRSEGDKACITIADDGRGIPREQRERIFEPFFTTKDVGRGTGLGLAVALGILEERGGAIRVDGREPRGTLFTIELPRAS